jgi:cytochrome c-type biogenesis protein CcmH/NrfF
VKRTGMIIILIGLFTTFYSGFGHIMREKIAEFIKMEPTKNIEHTIYWRSYAGVGMIVIGGVILVLGMNKKDENEILKK